MGADDATVVASPYPKTRHLRVRYGDSTAAQANATVECPETNPNPSVRAVSRTTSAGNSALGRPRSTCAFTSFASHQPPQPATSAPTVGRQERVSRQPMKAATGGAHALPACIGSQST